MSPMSKTGRTERTGVFSRILIPTDLTDGAARSLRLAVALARDGRATVTLVHVVQQVPGLPPGEMRGLLRPPHQEVETQIRQHG
jgi:nucleotide-binding universal stress UspA family protein